MAELIFLSNCCTFSLYKMPGGPILLIKGNWWFFKALSWQRAKTAGVSLSPSASRRKCALAIISLFKLSRSPCDAVSLSPNRPSTSTWSACLTPGMPSPLEPQGVGKEGYRDALVTSDLNLTDAWCHFPLI